MFPTPAFREGLAERLDLSPRAVQVWYQNRRQRLLKPSTRGGGYDGSKATRDGERSLPRDAHGDSPSRRRSQPETSSPSLWMELALRERSAALAEHLMVRLPALEETLIPLFIQAAKERNAEAMGRLVRRGVQVRACLVWYPPPLLRWRW